ncbi:MAG TPA: GNAT family N-acetyltransferase [Desulfosporosinus sp.]|nr:GNAT family N-acetyltransferase [Desulfosporosinus sp.]
MTDQRVNHTIRRAKPSDLSGMIKLLGILFSIETDFVVDEGTQQRGLEMMLADGTNRCIMVAEINQHVVGMCTAQMLVSTAEGGIVALIEDLVVEDEWRGEGIGKELLLSAGNWAITRGVTRLQLLADRNNVGALEFYEKMDWEVTRMICLNKKSGTCGTPLSVLTTQSKLAE